MDGTQTGTLEVILGNSEVIWSKKDRQENTWLMAEIQLPSGDYKVNQIHEYKIALPIKIEKFSLFSWHFQPTDLS